MSVRSTWLCLLFCVCQCCLISPLVAKEIHLGILDWRTLEDFDQHWLPALQGLETLMPEHQVYLYPMTLDELDAAVAADTLDFLITNPGHYVALSAEHSVAPIAQLEHLHRGLPLHYVGSVVLARQDRTDLNHLVDLQGMRVGAVGIDSFGGYQLILDLMLQQGLNLEKLDVNWQFTGFPMDQLLHQLVSGQLDVVITRSCLAEMIALDQGFDLAEVKVIAPIAITDYPCMTSSQLYPGWPLLRTERVSSVMAREVVAALMQSDPVIVNEDRIMWQPPVSYQAVYEVFERLRIGPFAAFPHNPILHWIQMHRPWLIGGLALFAVLMLHYIRAEYLVRRRTRELQMSQHKQREAELAAQHHQDELRHAARFTLMGELAAGLAHELNQPLTAIANYARGSVRHLRRENTDLLQRRTQLQEASEQIASQADHAAAVIRNIRAFLKKDAGEFGWVHIDRLMDDALLFCQTRLNQAKVTPVLNIEELLPNIYSHRIYLLQILANLITNALDSMVECSAEQPSLFLTVYRDEGTSEIVFSVADQGKGIDPIIAARVFEPFMTTRKEGMGLGLSLSKSLAEALGGQLALMNRSQGGAMAELRLPIKQQAQETHG